MAMNKELLNIEGINGTGEGVVNVNDPDFIALREAIEQDANQQSPEDKIRYGLQGLRYRMEHYISEKEPEKLIKAGDFLKMFLELVGVKNKVFARYVGLEESNLSSILKGRRKVNMDLAMKFGNIFQLRPELWLLVQSKNELLEVDHASKTDYQKFQLNELLKKAS